jgi:hypothetical protein
MFNSKIQNDIKRIKEALNKIRWCEGCKCLIGTEQAFMVSTDSFCGQLNTPYCLKCKPNYDKIVDGKKIKITETIVK